MSISQIACISCGTLVNVPSDSDITRCAYCNASLHILRDNGYETLQLAENIGENIQEEGYQTHAVTKEGTQSPSSSKQQNVVDSKSFSPKNWLIAYLLLCLLIGFFGVPRFYTEHTLIGFIQLFTLGGCVIWWLIDPLLIGTNRYRDLKSNMLNNPKLKFGRATSFGILAWIGTTFICSVFAMSLDEKLFNITGESSRGGPLFFIGMIFSIFIGMIVFTYILKPNAALWVWLRRLLPSKKTTP